MRESETWAVAGVVIGVADVVSVFQMSGVAGEGSGLALWSI